MGIIDKRKWSMVHHWPRAEMVRVTLVTIRSAFVSFRPLIYHEFYLFLAMVYRCFRNYLLCFGDVIS